MISCHVNSAAGYRYLPFAVFMGFIALEELIRILAGQGFFTLESTTLYYLYPVKVVVVGYLLYIFRKKYSELRFKELAGLSRTFCSCGLGLLVFVLWIKMDWMLGTTGLPQGFNPQLVPGRITQIVMLFFRIAGAVIIVPLMEELFWRSFLIRYIVDRHFDKIPLGTFTWGSFLLTVILFGLEHNYIYAGIMAGVFYNLLLYRTRSLAQCVLAHSVTNLALAIYVVYSGKWQFW